MSNTQSIIVYRNPIEQQIWESGIIAPILGSGLVFLVLMLLGMKAIELIKLPRFSLKKRGAENAILVIAGLLSIATLAYLLQR